jgi:hypothetical protein
MASSSKKVSKADRRKLGYGSSEDKAFASLLAEAEVESRLQKKRKPESVVRPDAHAETERHLANLAVARNKAACERAAANWQALSSGSDNVRDLVEEGRIRALAKEQGRRDEVTRTLGPAGHHALKALKK